MRIMGIDYGDRQIGVAVSDELFLTAQGVTTLRNSGDERVLHDIAKLAKEYGVTELVVGLPKNMNGTIGPRGELAQAFARDLGETAGLPVTMWDERLTTMSAQRTLIEADVSRKKRKEVIDRMAAALILQNYMDSRRR
ncbi:Holliday junction resolvase RuvX [Paenibacillus antri]|uniref:Putative pre-16S rRNA nuclease n=1 Tax=Paenibacillus antri TaxID=2582848 RepID=A0A5R9GAW2_9BACL|nr:Holliday junction resolvase RuvX [Paenibacillus antri]TLS53597.1 Holliday junction resolvase RuvX [Paenibacillus antri]